MPTPQPEFVVNVLWKLTGVDGDNTAWMEGTSQFEQEGDTFTPYADLTEAQVLGWVQDQLGENGIANAQANVEGQINSMINPPVTPTSEPLPW
jgi:hypothetical protein